MQWNCCWSQNDWNICKKKIMWPLKRGPRKLCFTHLPRPQISISRSFFCTYSQMFSCHCDSFNIYGVVGNLTDLHHCIVVSYKFHFPQLLHDGGAAFTEAAAKQLLNDGGTAFTGAATKQLWRDWDCHRGRRDWVFVNQGVGRPGGKKSF